MKLFDHNGPVMDALRKLTDLMFCNILFCLLSLPLFTSGAALSALYTCTFALVEEREDPFIIRQFWNAFRKNFVQSTLLWAVMLGGIGLLGAYYKAVEQLGGALTRTYRVTFFLLCLLFLLGFQYVFPMQARFQMKLRHVLKNSWLLSIAALPWTLCTLAVTAAAVYITLFMDPGFLNMAVFLWAVLLFAVVAYLNSFFFLKAFQKVKQD